MIGKPEGHRLKLQITVGLVLAILLTLPAAALTPAAQARARPQWTFMIYLDGDNNLDSFSAQNVEAMKSVGSTRDVNVLVFWDRLDDVANLYKVERDALRIVSGFELNGKEANMGDPSTLRTFIHYATHQFAAAHYVLVLWDHGDDFMGCCWDEHPADHLSHQEVTDALSGFSLDILAFDACVEGMIDVVYEYAWAGSQIDYVVATEGYVPVEGYPYDTILGDLVAQPTMTALQLSKVMVNNYIAFYDALRPATRNVELASIDMSFVNTLVLQLGDLTRILEGYLLNVDRDAYHSIIASARGAGNLAWSEYGWDAFIDFPTFIANLHTADGDEIPEAAALSSTLADAIYANASHSMQSAKGMGIFFPNSYGSFVHNTVWHGADYLAIQLPHQGWWNFLLTYWNT